MTNNTNAVAAAFVKLEPFKAISTKGCARTVTVNYDWGCEKDQSTFVLRHNDGYATIKRFWGVTGKEAASWSSSPELAEETFLFLVGQEKKRKEFVSVEDEQVFCAYCQEVHVDADFGGYCTKCGIVQMGVNLDRELEAMLGSGNEAYALLYQMRALRHKTNTALHADRV